MEGFDAQKAHHPGTTAYRCSESYQRKTLGVELHRHPFETAAWYASVHHAYPKQNPLHQASYQRVLQPGRPLCETGTTDQKAPTRSLGLSTLAAADAVGMGKMAENLTMRK